ncbi:uncharacterized protein LOC130726762 [Lotus japonicus]|uniref:uncharacterized protein LOC130726762 n=1 Tax=Lotus japonicus TaxID=34305 RepID=UPI00258EED46|nr:uncharacterized protein LOC130726762 [Lotus japonicus]
MGGESHFSGGSSVSSGYGRRRNVVLCKCGEVAPVVTTWTNENGNIGRRFYGCGRFKEQNRRHCDFFQWYDELEGNPRDKKIIAGLLRRVDEMKKNQAMLIKCCVLGWSVAVFLLIVCAILMVKMMK